jgi:hypothetical protein
MQAVEFVTSIVQEFAYRKRSVNPDSPVEVEGQQTDYAVFFNFAFEDRKFDILIPTPYEDRNGNSIIGDTVQRCEGSWVIGDKIYRYLDFIQHILCNRIDGLFDVTTTSSQIARLTKLHQYINPSLIVRSAQRLIDAVTNSLPLSEAPLKDYFMNKRVMLVDSRFKGLTPQKKLLYQIEKEIKFFPWSGIGLSDGSAAENNYLLMDRIQNFTPFNVYDNPMRNLYSTLGMKGVEGPLIFTEEEDRLGAKRTGMNLVTVFLDHPNNYEDQIIMSNRFLKESISEPRRITTFGTVLVEKGQKIQSGQVLALEPNQTKTTFETACDEAVVEDILQGFTYFNGNKIQIHTLIIKLTRNFKHGFKITNRHGNKGVVIFDDTGFALDPVKGKIPVDIIVSARSVEKRKNYGQILEALTNNLKDDSYIKISSDFKVSMGKLSERLIAKGYAPDLTCPVETQWGTFKAVVGKVFWGVIKTVEDQTWTDEDLADIRSNGIHRAGLKLSPIEIKALSTIFGEDAKILFEEIMKFSSGKLQTMEQIYILMSGLGSLDEGLSKIDVEHVKPVDQEAGYFQEDHAYKDTIADIEKYPNPFLLKLPFTYYTAVYRGAQIVEEVDIYPTDADEIYATQYIYVPGYEERKVWMHQTGLYGMNEITTLFNNLVDYCNRPRTEINWKVNAFCAMKTLLHTISRRMSSKRGVVNQNILSVRYPSSIKGVAIQNMDLPKNTVGIHESMAEQLGVTKESYVIVERFPCLGFTSMRIQKVQVHKEESKRFSIEVSGNSLVSLGLDFDGDVIYLMSFSSKEAQELLRRTFHFPDKRMHDILETMSSKIEPVTAELGIQDYQIKEFPPPSQEHNAEIIKNLAGVKLYTGPVIALGYNVSRIIEPYVTYKDSLSIAIELLLDKVANSVFSQKHGIKSLQNETIEAICLADPEKIMALFGSHKERARYSSLRIKEEEAQRVCEIIRFEASMVNVNELQSHYERHIKKGKSNIISTIVRRRRKNYFATRAALEPYHFLVNILDRECPKDLVAAMIRGRIGDRLRWKSPQKIEKSQITS